MSELSARARKNMHAAAARDQMWSPCLDVDTRARQLRIYHPIHNRARTRKDIATALQDPGWTWHGHPKDRCFCKRLTVANLNEAWDLLEPFRPWLSAAARAWYKAHK